MGIARRLDLEKDDCPRCRRRRSTNSAAGQRRLRRSAIVDGWAACSGILIHSALAHARRCVRRLRRAGITARGVIADAREVATNQRVSRGAARPAGATVTSRECGVDLTRCGRALDGRIPNARCFVSVPLDDSHAHRSRTAAPYARRRVRASSDRRRVRGAAETANEVMLEEYAVTADEHHDPGFVERAPQDSADTAPSSVRPASVGATGALRASVASVM
jgi:hypothetical protein